MGLSVAAGADSSGAEMMQADRDQPQSHPRAFLCPQNSPCVLSCLALPQGGHRAESGSK